MKSLFYKYCIHSLIFRIPLCRRPVLFHVGAVASALQEMFSVGDENVIAVISL